MEDRFELIPFLLFDGVSRLFPEAKPQDSISA
jgi:hypothetical protein